jgi:hypothetical protein
VDPPDTWPIHMLALGFALLEPCGVGVLRDDPLNQDLRFVASHHLRRFAGPAVAKRVCCP